MSIPVPAHRASIKTQGKSLTFVFTYMRRSWRVERSWSYGMWGQWRVTHCKGRNWSEPYRVDIFSQGVTKEAAENALRTAWERHYRAILAPDSP